MNRLDEIVYYHPLDKKAVTGIVDLLLADLNRRLTDKQLSCTVTPAAKAFIADNGFDPQFGARPLRRFIQSKVETLLGREIIEKDPAPGTNLTVDVENERLVVR